MSGAVRDQAPDLITVLRRRAADTPDRVLFTFLPDGEEPGPSLTYGELDRAARDVAVDLLRLAHPGDRAVLALPTGPDFVTAFFGCLYAGVVAVPSDPSPAPAGVERHAAVIADCAPAVVFGDVAALGGAARLDPAGTPGVGSGWAPAPPGQDALAFLQYTSGSTGAPKGA